MYFQQRVSFLYLQSVIVGKLLTVVVEVVVVVVVVVVVESVDAGVVVHKKSVSSLDCFVSTERKCGGSHRPGSICQLILALSHNKLREARSHRGRGVGERVAKLLLICPH